VRENPHIVIGGGVALIGAALAPALVPLIISAASFARNAATAARWASGGPASLGDVVAGGLLAVAQSAASGHLSPLIGWLAGTALGFAAWYISDVVWWLVDSILHGGYREHVEAVARMAASCQSMGGCEVACVKLGY
jgi:hypothetical protein